MNEFDQKWALEFAGRRALDSKVAEDEFVLLPAEKETRAWEARGHSLEPKLEEVLGAEDLATLRSKVHARTDESTLIAILRLVDEFERKAKTSTIASSPTLHPPSIDPNSGIVLREGVSPPAGDAKQGTR